MTNSTLEKNIDLLIERFTNRRYEIKDSVAEIALLLNEDIPSLEKPLLAKDVGLLIKFLLHDLARLLVESNLDQIKHENKVLKKAKILTDEISKKSLELYDLITELEKNSHQSSLFDFKHPSLDELQIIKSAAELSYRDLEKKGHVEMAIFRKKNFERSFLKTIKEILRENPEESTEYFPEVKYIFHTTGDFYKAHNYHNIERQASPRALLRLLIKHTIFCVKRGIFPKKMLTISPNALTDIITVALDLPKNKPMDVRSTRDVFKEFPELNENSFKK